MKTLPQVRDVGAVSVMPFLNTTGGSLTPIVIEGQPTPAPGREPSALWTVATPGYFSAMRISVLEGRTLEAHDDANRAPVRSFPRGLRNDIGAMDHQSANGSGAGAGRCDYRRIIGVVGKVRRDALDGPATLEIFLPHAQLPFTGITFVARTSGDPNAAAARIESRIHAISADDEPVYRTAAMQDLVDDTPRPAGDSW